MCEVVSYESLQSGSLNLAVSDTLFVQSVPVFYSNSFQSLISAFYIVGMVQEPEISD